MAFDKERFRSFAERYLIQRAPQFRTEHEMEDAHACVARAKAVYAHIDNVANVEAEVQYRGAYRGPGAPSAPPDGVSMYQVKGRKVKRVYDVDNPSNWVDVQLP